MQIKQTKIQSLVRYDAHLLYQYNVRVPQTVMCIKKGLSPIYLHLIFYILQLEISSLMNWIFFLDSLNWMFAGYTGSKNPVQTWKLIQFIKLEILS